MHRAAAAPFQYYPALCTLLQLLHFNNILLYAQYCNYSISVISFTMHSTAIVPFQLYPALCTVLQPLHFNNILHYVF